METAVSITLIICITIIIVAAVCALSPSKDERYQKLKDIDKVVCNFQESYLKYDREKEKYVCTASYDIILNLCRTISRMV